MTAIICKNLCKTFRQGDEIITGLDDVSINIKEGEFVCLSGPSGSGKTTLLNAMGGLDTPDSGEILIGNTRLDRLGKGALADMRLDKIGFVFQSYNLIPVLTARENVEFVMQVRGVSAKERAALSRKILKEVGLAGMENRRPAQLSGGQQQRVAIGRALATRPSIILADEPTGNLDSKNSRDVMNLLKLSVERYNQTLIMITHNQAYASYAERVLNVEDGVISELGGVNG